MSTTYAVPATVAPGFRRRPRPAQGPTDRRLAGIVAAAVEGDPDALRELYVRFKDHVYGYVAAIVRDEHEAEDVTQQVFVKVLGALDRYEAGTGTFSAWVLRIARNTALDHLRARRPVLVADVRAVHEGADRRASERFALQAALATLPHDQRRVVLLRHLVGLSPAEIADADGRTLASVHGLHHRGRRALQAELLSRSRA
jgi:RNA polymerase sigma-70 factor (ECF subfamily)